MILSSKHTGLLANAAVLESQADNLEKQAEHGLHTPLVRGGLLGRAKALRKRATEFRTLVAKEASHG